jgi:insertion element IS1 protein InsB
MNFYPLKRHRVNSLDTAHPTGTVGKRNTQKIERKHLTLRTRIKRLARRTICFSKSVVMHDVVIGLFINRVAFGLNIP